MKYRLPVCIAALLVTGLILSQALLPAPRQEHLPGGEAAPRTLLRIWVCSGVGGGESWLKERLKAWEKQTPGAMTFLRSVTPQELTRQDAVLPDILLYTPGSITAPQELFTPMEGISGLRESLLRAGRWQNRQYGLPLCYAGYALAVDSALSPHPAASPAPTTLLGRPAATAMTLPSATPPLPKDLVPLAPGGCGLFTLGCLMPDHPPLDNAPSSAEVFSRFKSRQASAALLTTGQITALNGLFPFRVITPGEIITDQVWLASVFPGAEESAARLLTFLTQPESQRQLSRQGLYTVREDLRLYAAGAEGLMEAAAARALTAINAYIPPEETAAAAWQFYHGSAGLSQALLPLI